MKENVKSCLWCSWYSFLSCTENSALAILDFHATDSEVFLETWWGNPWPTHDFMCFVPGFSHRFYCGLCCLRTEAVQHKNSCINSTQSGAETGATGMCSVLEMWTEVELYPLCCSAVLNRLRLMISAQVTRHLLFIPHCPSSACTCTPAR